MVAIEGGTHQSPTRLQANGVTPSLSSIMDQQDRGLASESVARPPNTSRDPTTTSPSSSPSEWRTSSQPAPVSRRRPKKHTSTHVNQKPANSRVISSIIASLDDINESPALHPSQPWISSATSTRSSGSGASRSHKSSRAPSSLPTPSLRRSLSLGIGSGEHSTKMGEDRGIGERGADGDAEDDDDDDDAAAFPIVPTSRRPSVRSSGTASPVMSPALSAPASIKEYFRSTPRDSRSSLSLTASEGGRPKLGRSNSRLSIESWSRRLSSASQLSLESKTEIPIRKSSSRQPSCETLKPATIREERISALVTRSVPATPVGKSQSSTPPPGTPELARTSPTGRLYLDDTIQETDESAKQISNRPQKQKRLFLRDTPEDECAPDLGSANDESKRQPTSDRSPTKPSDPKKTPIADAIPLRVSSLNRTPLPRQKKSRSAKTDKGKGVAVPSHKASPWYRSNKPSNSNSESLLEELDQDDTTVKRIRELQRRRDDRLRVETAATAAPGEAAAAAADLKVMTDTVRSSEIVVPNSSATRTDTKLPAAKPSTASGRSDRVKHSPKTATRSHARTSDARKAHKVLGLDEPSESTGGPELSAARDHNRYQKSNGASPELIKGKLVNSSNPRRVLATLPTHSLDNDSSLRQRSTRPSNQHDAFVERRESVRSHLLDGLDLGASDLTPPSTAHSTRSRLSRSNSTSLDTWSRPDISINPGEDVKERRKSMSDARDERILEEEVLEERWNSVHAAVEDYLAAPRLNQKIRNAQTGRLIAFSEVGDPHGAAVIVCVGMGLTRFVTAFYDELAATLGLRLITLDRPGVGESEPYPERERIGPLSWPDDVVSVTQHLGISQFSMLAHSAGAIYALATALILPHCIRGKVQLLAPWIPPSQFDTYGIKSQSPDTMPVGGLPRSQRLLRVLPIPFFKAANGGLFSPSSLKVASVRNTQLPLASPGRDGPRSGKPGRRNESHRRESMILMDQVVPEKPVTTMFPLPELSEEDISDLQPVRQPSLNLSATATPTDPEWTYVAEALEAAEHSARERQAAYSTLLTERTWSVATRGSNPAVDLLVCLERHRDIGFRYVDIQRQIVITHGSEDKRVPVENIKWMGDQINRRAATNWSPDAKQEFRERGGCEIRVLPGEGHGLMASPRVMADVLTEIGREWTGRHKW